MLIDIFGYREWAKSLHGDVKDTLETAYSGGYPEIAVHMHETISDSCATPSASFFVGWSEIVPEEFYTSRDCFVLHPSALPLYRGGSPIQHQIIDGLDTSAVTIFKLVTRCPEIDSGPIAWQMAYSLDGELSDVLARIAAVGADGVVSVVNAIRQERLALVFQQGLGMVLPRRKPAESQIFWSDFPQMTARQFHDKVRALQDPYPNAFISFEGGSKVYIIKTRLDEPEAAE